MIEGMGSRNQAPFPEKRKRSKGPSKASILTDEVIRYVKADGGTARRVNTQGQWDEALQKWRPSGMKRGYEDIDVTMKVITDIGVLGLKIGVEIKIGTDSQFDKQLKRQLELEAAGAKYFIVKDIDSFISQYKNYKISIIIRTNK
jgi:hypothetical protein